MKYKYILLFIMLITACKQKRVVSPSFYYWKTVYKSDTLENAYLKQFHSQKLYVRIMDVDLDNNYSKNPVPVAPISFADSVPGTLALIPVVFIANDVLKERTEPQIKELARKITSFVKAKTLQAGKRGYQELQIDCDWTATTRDHYFKLLEELRKVNKDKVLSSTLRLHQLKNQGKSGIPPVDKVLLMCYNMGNLRQYGNQNSILDLAEFKKYAGENLARYPKDMDIALPLFSWTVVFRDQQYIGISKRVKWNDLIDTAMFLRQKNGLYQSRNTQTNLGLQKNDVLRYEESNLNDIKSVAQYLSAHLPGKPFNLLFYHLDHHLLKNYQFNELEEINNLLR
ncbi:hypothetical protein [Pedobacter sp. MC2016-24]|uniref:hypothetical protein n=1 Tax=Pedobacter sp. MC2016-24 TaxID=2780090 RepID=UPI0018815E73|nr:hypothetical protein [Pedobacter sp. MC2016-24]MBE9599660.1 hypothetical protein [Pedobacter sp. MC2016-24]